NPLLFGAIAVLVILKLSTIVTPQLLVRANIGFGFLAAYDFCDQIIPRYIFVLPFLVSLAVALIAGYVVYLYSARVIGMQKRTLLPLLSIAILCVVVFPIQQRRYEARELAQLPSPPSTARNAVVIVVDTSRADHLSTYGYSRETSPTLTEL